MAFNSLLFLAFSAGTCLLYFLAPASRRWWVLLAASYIFYFYAGWRAGGFILFTTVTAYGAGRGLEKLGLDYKARLAGTELSREEKQALKAAHLKKKRLLLAAVLIANFGLLFLLKYLAAAVGWANLLFNANLSGLSILLPLGISFYMFQSAGYVIDVYRGKIGAEKNLARFALFVSFFPQIVQGPISRYDQLADQLYTGHSWDADRARDGVQLMLWGYFKKIALADLVAIGVNQVFNNYPAYGGLFLFGAAVGYGIQVYCDFSGGIDVARGLALVLGISLTENFRRPYFAISIADFWRRWHITLGAWMKDYLFYPLALSRPFARLGQRSRRLFPGHVGKVLPTCLATLLVFIIVGMWHGSSAKYVVYGVWNGLFIIGGTLLGPALTRLTNSLGLRGRGLQIGQILLTFLVVGVSRYFSRAASLRASLAMLAQTLRWPGLSQLTDGTWATLGWSKPLVLYLAAGLMTLFFVSLAQEKGYSIRQELNKRSPWLQGLVLFAGLLVLLWFSLFNQGYIAAEFIYMKF